MSRETRFIARILVLLLAAAITMATLQGASIYLAANAKSDFQRWREGMDEFRRDQKRKNAAVDEYLKEQYNLIRETMQGAKR